MRKILFKTKGLIEKNHNYLCFQSTVSKCSTCSTVSIDQTPLSPDRSETDDKSLTKQPLNNLGPLGIYS